MSLRLVTREQILPPYVRLWNLRYPDDLTTEDRIAADFARMPPNSYQELWTDDQGGTAILVQDEDGEGEKVNFHVVVDPNQEQERLTEAMQALRDLPERSGAKAITTWARSDEPLYENTFTTVGFKVVQTVRLTRLDLTSFNISEFRPEIERLQREGLAFATIKDLQEQGRDWPAMLYEPSWEMIQDMPHAHPPVKVPLERFREIMANPLTHDQSLMFVVMDGDAIVAYTRLENAPTMPHLIRTGLSGLVRSHRRRGIITALKAHSLNDAKARGYLVAQTDNDETNPMFNINLRLGFKEAWQWLHFSRSP